MNTIKHALYQFGGWLTADPRRIQFAIMCTVLVVMAAGLIVGLSSNAVQIAPGTGGGGVGNG